MEIMKQADVECRLSGSRLHSQSKEVPTRSMPLLPIVVQQEYIKKRYVIQFIVSFPMVVRSGFIDLSGILVNSFLANE